MFSFSLVVYSLLLGTIIEATRITIPITRHVLLAPVKYSINTVLVTSTGEYYVIQLNNSLDRVYTGPINIGSPKSKLFNVVFDTGSADLWVFATNNDCTYCISCENSDHCCTSKSDCCFFSDIMHSYNSSSSQTYQAFTPEASWSIQYGKGGASGYLVRDTVSIGGVPVTSQVFAAATSWEEDLISCSEPMDGILGLAMKKASESGYNTLIENLYEQGKISSKIFSLRLSGQDDQSLMIIGPPDPQYYVDDLIYSDVIQADQTGMWFIQYVGLLYTPNNETRLTKSNSVWIDQCEDSDPCLALIDSGTSYITMPSAEYDTLTNYMTSVTTGCWSSYGQYVCPANELVNLPNIWIQINDKAFVLKPADYMIEVGCTNKPGYYCLAMSALDQMGDHTYIFGDTFLRNYYVVYDESNSEMGFGSMDSLDDAILRPGDNTAWEYIQIIVFVVGGLGIIACIAASCWKYRYPKPPQGVLLDSYEESEIPYRKAKENRMELDVQKQQIAHEHDELQEGQPPEPVNMEQLLIDDKEEDHY